MTSPDTLPDQVKDGNGTTETNHTKKYLQTWEKAVPDYRQSSQDDQREFMTAIASDIGLSTDHLGDKYDV